MTPSISPRIEWSCARACRRKGGAAPITTDPPKHAGAKALLLPAFTLDAIERYAAKTREICRELVENVAGKSACDAAVDYAQEIPVRLDGSYAGHPGAGRRAFPHGSIELLELGITDDDVSHACDRRDDRVFPGRGRETPRCTGR